MQHNVTDNEMGKSMDADSVTLPWLHSRDIESLTCGTHMDPHDPGPHGSHTLVTQHYEKLLWQYH